MEGGGRSEEAKVILRSDTLPSRQANVLSSTEEKGKSVAIDGYESGSDVDPEEERMFDEGFTQVEVRKEGIYSYYSHSFGLRLVDEHRERSSFFGSSLLWRRE